MTTTGANSGFLKELADSFRDDDIQKTIKNTYRWVQSNIAFDALDSLNSVHLYTPEGTITRKSGNCVAIAEVFMTLLELNNIPSKFRLLLIRPTKTKLGTKIILMGRTEFPHGLVDVLIDDRWVSMLPMKGLRFNPTHGHTILDLKESNGKPKCVLIEDYGVFEGVPAREIEALGAKLHPHLHGKGAFIRYWLSKKLTTPR